MPTPVITKGPRGLEDRGKADGSGNPLTTAQILSLKPGAAHTPIKGTHITLQASKVGRIVQLTAPADRENRETGTKIKAKPLVLNFAAGQGFVRLDLAKEEDRRKWMRVVGSEQAAIDFENLNITHKPNPEDGTDPIAAHPRYQLGHAMGFWNTADAQAASLKGRRSTMLDMLAKDDEMANFITSVTPDQLAELLQKRKDKLSGKAAQPAGQQDMPGDVDGDGDGNVDVDADDAALAKVKRSATKKGSKKRQSAGDEK